MTDLILASEDEPSGPKFERIERIQQLVPGSYLRATIALPEELIPAGELLAIAKVDYVDGQPHTVYLRAHPRHYGRKDMRTVAHRNWTLEHHAFRISALLNAFESATEAEARAQRQREQQEDLHGIALMQADMQQTQADPEKMARVVAEGLAERRRKSGQGEPASLPAVSDTLPPLTLGTALARGVDETSILQLNYQAKHYAEVASVQAEWLRGKTEELAEAFKHVTLYLSEQSDVLMAVVREREDHIKKILDGIKSLDLYIGKDVEVHRIASGQSAPSSEPLTIIQRKLVMAEEMSAWLDVDSSTDFNSVPAFINQLAANQSLVEQIFPGPRVIVCMAATRYYVNYEGASSFESHIRNVENLKVFLLVRDGGNLFYVASPIESHLGASRLFPTLNEANEYFQGVNGEQITFESLRYTSALSNFERHTLHYKRLLIMLCGLDHREKLFGDFYDGAQSLSFVSMEFQRRYMRFITDDDASTMIEGGTRRLEVMVWLRERNRFLTSGSRVFGVWRQMVSNDMACPGADRLNAHYNGPDDCRIAFPGENAEAAVELPVVTSNRKPRNVKVYPGRYRKDRNAVFDHSLRTPYIVLDDVEPEDLYHYIHDRASRVQNTEFITLFKRAHKWLQAERAIEAPTRNAMLAAIIENGICPAATATATLSTAIRLWRAANRGRDLPSLNDVGSSQWNELLDVAYLIEHAASSQLTRVEHFLQSEGLTPVRLCLTGKAKLVAYCEPRPEERDDRLTPHVWLNRLVIRLGKRSITESSRTWCKLPAHSAAEFRLKAYDNESDWLGLTSGFSSLQSKRAQFERCERGLAYIIQLGANMDAEAPRLATRFLVERDSTDALHNQVATIGLQIPFGLCLLQEGRQRRVQFIILGCQDARSALYCMLPAGEAQADFIRRAVKPYLHKDSQMASFLPYRDRTELGRTLSIDTANQKSVERMEDRYMGARFGGGSAWGDREKSTFDDRMRARIAGDDCNSCTVADYWFPAGFDPLTAEKGLDNVFGTSRPVDHPDAGQLWHVYANENESAETPYFYVEIPGKHISYHYLEGYRAVLVAFWYTAEEREFELGRVLPDPSRLTENPGSLDAPRLNRKGTHWYPRG